MTNLKIRFFITCFSFAIVLSGCKNSSPVNTVSDGSSSNPLFTLLDTGKTHINFTNNITEGLNTNVLMYEYFYNGGGVAIADVNGDGLQDIYFTANMTGNKLYLNKGKMKFEDITDANVAGRPGPWKTGVTMADVNGDGKMDFYLCYSGKLPAENRVNQLFINQGNDADDNPVFKDEAKIYGLDDSSYSTQAYFFDLDRDGDLDLFLLNHNPNSLPVLDEANTAAILNKEDLLAGVQLFRNDNNHFINITSKSGLSSSSLTYGLAAGISDINNDGWPDIYISNDYTVPDYLYINNHDGTFTDQLKKHFGHTSEFSMGNDVADVNNDALPDIFTLDMLPKDNRRQKLLFAPDNYEKFDLTLRTGFYYQYMRNMLQLNNGNGTFSEIGQLAGLSNTDWSWTPLLADYDNDGWKDLLVTNGYVRDYTNLDFIKYMNDYIQSKGRLKRENVLDLVHQMPASNVTNYIFKNNGNLTFSDVSKQWGFDSASNSNGAIYADLDNDGDLDIVMNNINKPAFIYENESNKQPDNNYLQIKPEGENKNIYGIGAKIILYSKDDQKQYLEQMPSRGYLSSVSPILHFGLGKETSVDSLRIIWLSGKQQLIKNIKSNQTLTVLEKNATSPYHVPAASPSWFTEVASPIKYQQTINTINDFKRQPLLINPLSFAGPCFVKGDLNGDGLEDIYAGGESGQAGQLFIQEKNGRFINKQQPAFEGDKQSEDADAVFFDANGDGYTDIYVASGGYHNYAASDNLLQDRLYLNDGKGNYTKSTRSLPAMLVSKSCARVADFNGDGFPDIFVGGRVTPGRYPETPQSYLLINDGKGHFTDKISSIAPSLQKIGMVTDAAWIDINNDKKMDLVVVGEWMPVTVFINANGHLQNDTKKYFDKEYSGWWNKLLTGDFNKDGKQDLIIGNMGLNTQCKVSDKEPAEMFYKDFDDNGSVDPVLCFYIEGKSYPYVTRDELLEQVSTMRSRYTDYKSYADATLKDIFTPEELKGVNHLQANYLKTIYFETAPDGKFHEKELPLQVQFSPVYTITQLDFNKDGNEDLLLCGNINHGRLKSGKYDANYGILLKGDGKGNFEYITQQQSGFQIWGDVRSVININQTLLFGINQQAIKAYKIK